MKALRALRARHDAWVLRARWWKVVTLTWATLGGIFVVSYGLVIHGLTNDWRAFWLYVGITWPSVILIGAGLDWCFRRDEWRQH